MELKDTLEHTEHISHAAHDEGGGHGDPRLGTYIGITMAVLGVLLAFCAAKVGGERTELVQALVEQSNAHAQYHAQDVKHRVAVIGLQQVHATAFGSGADTLNKNDVLGMAGTVERYLKESNLAKSWAASFDPAVLAHVHAQESYEKAQLGSEVGIVLASVALLMRRKLLWIVAIILGVVSIGIVGTTYVQTASVVKAAEEKIEETSKVYEEARTKDKTTDSEAQLLSSIKAWAGVPATTAPAAEAHPAEH
jgi:hypothetical protein